MGYTFGGGKSLSKKECFLGEKLVEQCLRIRVNPFVNGTYSKVICPLLAVGLLCFGVFSQTVKLVDDPPVVPKPKPGKLTGQITPAGKIGTLKRFKDDVKEVTSGYDCGMGLEGNDDIQVGDLIEAYVIEEVARKKD